ncbi:hypothetical protein K503DRAFT_441423 [Rhizopogon vinicolor AM-OR11-026]|uniref:DUF6534 domain-containing protein n=1 Tax=Rhizopogon vinicolor AM-OR11-026 TaxID=1314800 RepID=A0A1B7NAF1_9AGAM|nr:hypothetical protein K503DRAFT_441423 [Rhizopogon vinicolor AM-OR11-026]
MLSLQGTRTSRILETAHTALSIHFIEYYLILNFGDLTTLEYAVWSMAATYFIGFIIAYTVNFCFIWRIRQLSQKRWIAVCFVIFATVRCGFGLTNCSMNFRYPMWKNFRAHVFPTMVVGWVLSALVDSSIALTLCLYLRKRRTGMKSTDSILSRLLLYSINTGAVTSFFAILVIIMASVYAVSFLASLNNRKSAREKAKQSAPGSDGVALSLLPSSSMFKTSHPKPSHLTPFEVRKSVVLSIYGDDPVRRSTSESGC